MSPFSRIARQAETDGPAADGRKTPPLLTERQRRDLFERLITPHVPAAYNLARWLLSSDSEAEDQVQEASLRAYRHLDTFRGGDGRAWFLVIVRNLCYTFLKRRREPWVSFEDEIGDPALHEPGPETVVLHRWDAQRLQAAMENLPLPLREAIVLRELEDLSYKEIAAIAEIPLGTVMSRLSRARKRLEWALREDEEGDRGLS
jgi:RNA polymerase sigma-70 factor (ECF subfamily)